MEDCMRKYEKELSWRMTWLLGFFAINCMDTALQSETNNLMKYTNIRKIRLDT